MADENTQGAEATPALSPAELASVEVGQRGFTEPTNVNTPAPSGPQRPDYVPEQFWKDGKVDVEGMAKSYGELRTKMDSGKPNEAPAAAPTEAPAADAVDATGKITAKPTEAAPADTPLAKAMATAADEFAASQEFTEETSKALAEAGIPVEIQQIYLNGLKAQAAEAVSAIHGYVGGEQTYTQMADWARQNLTDAELDAYNSALDNPMMRENAVRGLHARFSAARPSEGNLVSGGNNGANAGDVYSDRDALLKDQKDPRYATDPAFRKGVMDKLARSQQAGFQLVKRPMFERSIISN